MLDFYHDDFVIWVVLQNWYKMSGYFYDDDLVEKIEPDKIGHLTKIEPDKIGHLTKLNQTKLWYDEWLFNHDDLAKKNWRTKFDTWRNMIFFHS